MSGRDIDYDDWDGDGDGLPWELTMRAYQLMLRRSGRNVLAEVEAALLAMPEKRLMFGYLAKSPETHPAQDGWLPVSKQGETCVVGEAICAKRTARGESRMKVLRDLEDRITHYDAHDLEAFDAIEATAKAAKEVGIPKLLARHLSEVNDAGTEDETPEERWARVLTRVREMRVQAETPLPFRSKRWTGAVSSMPA